MIPDLLMQQADPASTISRKREREDDVSDVGQKKMARIHKDPLITLSRENAYQMGWVTKKMQIFSAIGLMDGNLPVAEEKKTPFTPLLTLIEHEVCNRRRKWIITNFAEELTKEIKEEDDDDVSNTCHKLGQLLLLVDRNYEKAQEIIGNFSLEDAEDQLEEACLHIYQETLEKIEAHHEKHARVALQDVDQATFHYMSMQFADLLLTKKGQINKGIVEDLFNHVMPERYQALVATENVWLVLESIAQDPLIAQLVHQVNPPKSENIPSCPSIRHCLNLHPEEKITKRHAQLFVVSAMLGHMRQAKAGTCFATACLIKALNSCSLLFLSDLIELTEEGKIHREVSHELRSYPFIARVTREFLDTVITLEEGKIASTRCYELSKEQEDSFQAPENGAHLSESPGIKKALVAMQVKEVEEILDQATTLLPHAFSVNCLLKAVAKIQSTRLNISEIKLLEKGQFAFGTETNHPLHRAYEQVAASMVDYFGSQYGIPLWIADLVREEIKPQTNAQKKLLEESFLPMFIRMRYRYNPNIDQTKILFPEGHFGVKENHFYGYELCDTALPDDFVYSKTFLKEYDQEAMFITLQRFSKYKEPEEWRSIGTQKDFLLFLQDVFQETAKHLEEDAYITAAQELSEKVSHSRFGKKLVSRINKQVGDSAELKKNEFNIMTKPWSFKWGGDFDAVLRSYFGFDKSPSRLRPYSGSPKEILAKTINFFKNQPEEIREEYIDPRNPVIINSPVHVFLLRGFEPTLMEAWQSEMPTNEYIQEKVLKPGLEVAGEWIKPSAREELIQFIEENRWATRYEEKEDWVRQELTDDSKAIFDQLLKENPTPTIEELKKILFQARAKDPNINVRNKIWEQQAALALERMSHRKDLVDFARNRKDTIFLSDSVTKKFRRKMRRLPRNLTHTQFREIAIDTAYKLRFEEMGLHDKRWKSKFSAYFDSKLLEILPDESFDKLLSSGIVTHDTNWKVGIKDVHFIFLVNPGTAQIEMAKYLPDTCELAIMEQSDWFPQKNEPHGHWNFPENYLAWKETPNLNFRKYMELPM